MAYASASDVNAIVPQAQFSATSRPSLTQVTALCDSVSLRIDATIGNVGYVVPVVTGTKALALLKEACTWGVLGQALSMRNTGATEAIGANGQPAENIWTVRFLAWLKALTNPQDPFELPDALRTSEQLLKQPDDVLRSFVQTVPDQTPFLTTANLGRYQVL